MDVSPSVIAFLASLGGQFRCKEYQAISDHKVQNQVLFGFGHPVPMFPDLEPVCFSMSGSNCCFLTCI